MKNNGRKNVNKQRRTFSPTPPFISFSLLLNIDLVL